MSDVMTSDSLIESIKRRATVPENQSTFMPEDLLAFAYEELQLALIPDILKYHEDYLLFEEEISIVANTQEYKIPYRAIGNRLRDVQYKSNDGNVTGEMTRVSIGDAFGSRQVGSFLRRFYIKGNKVVLVSEVGSSPAVSSLSMIYYIKPSSLVPNEEVGIIKSITVVGDGTVDLVLTSIPDKFVLLNSLEVSQKYDFYTAQSPSNILTKDFNVNSINATSKTININATDHPSSLQPGDHMSFATESSIPQIPSDLHPMLAQLTACRVYEAQNDAQGLQLASSKLNQMKEAAGMIIDNRVEDAPQKIVNKHSILRTSINARGFNRNK